MNKVKISVTNHIEVKGLSNKIIRQIRETLIIDNPKYIENGKMGYSNWQTPRRLRFIDDKTTLIPKGFLSRLKKMLIKEGIVYSIRHKTVNRPCLPVMKSKISFTGRPYGATAVDKIMKKRFGVLQAPTGSGKTVIAIETIVRRNNHTLIVVHTKELMHQWKERLLQFTNLQEEDIGLIGDGKKTFGLVTIGIINSLQKKQPAGTPAPYKYCNYFGYVVVDECHRAPSSTFSNFLKTLNTRYMLGLSATPYRRDGLSEVIHFFVGDILYVIDHIELQEQGHILRASLKVIKTDFVSEVDSINNYHALISELVADKTRNTLIVSEAIKQNRKKKGIVLLVSDRKEHCQTLLSEIPLSEKAVMLTGSTPTKRRQQIIKALNDGVYNMLVATAQLIGEGTDIADLWSIFLTTPISGTDGKMGKLIQVIGRIVRIAEGKDKALIVDFDDPCWMLKGSFGKRMRTYKEMGVKI
jgi:superfamily II DNA or RNA helicase